VETGQGHAQSAIFLSVPHAGNDSCVFDVIYTCLVTDIGKMLAFLGLILLVVGGALMLLGRTNLPLGRLPGDILYRGKNSTFYFPLATSILLSVVLSLLLYVIGRWKH